MPKTAEKTRRVVCYVPESVHSRAVLDAKSLGLSFSTYFSAVIRHRLGLIEIKEPPPKQITLNAMARGAQPLTDVEEVF